MAKYFTGLNYTLGNEDTTLEIELVKRYHPKNVFSVCGSGGRALPLCSDETENLTLSDLSLEQIHLAQLREATYRQLTHEDFLMFWGYFPYSDDNLCEGRKNLFLKLQLPVDVKSFFKDVFKNTHYHSVLYMGKWERTFQVLAKMTRLILGKDFDRILRFDDLEAQKKYYYDAFPRQKWKAVIFLLGNKTLFNALLYKGNFIEKNVAESHYDYYLSAFDRLFTNDLAQKSFFLQLCFYGKIQSLAGVPVEASAETHERISKSPTKTDYLTEDMIEHLKMGTKKYDFLSLSDVPSYFKGSLETEFMQLIRPSLNPGAIIVNRYYLRVPNCRLDGFTDVTNLHEHLVRNEKVQMYRIQIYKYMP
jgi:S-adenosylmethionine-diacylglycerol 3-amino-3-carboxypropyl transferase